MTEANMRACLLRTTALALAVMTATPALAEEAAQSGTASDAQVQEIIFTA